MITIKLGKYKAQGYGFNVEEKDGKLFVTKVSVNGAAFIGGLCRHDVIFSLNGDTVKDSATEFSHKLSKIKRDEIKLVVYRAGPGYDISRSLATSMSLIDLNNSLLNRQVLNPNFVSEEHIDSSLNSTWEELSEPLQIVRKQAYKKLPFDAISYTEAPRFSVKRANKFTSFQTKDPTYKIKKKTNTRMSEFATDQTDSCPRRSTVSGARIPCQESESSLRSPAGLCTNSQHSLSSSQLSSLGSVEVVREPLLPVMRPQFHLSDSENFVQDDISRSETVQFEVSVKVLSFKEKVRKPLFKRFSIEQDSLGLTFRSLDLKEFQMACNSTAINPLISGLSLYMDLWSANNTISNFFLPIGQQPYDSEIERSAVVDSLHIKYNRYDVEFLINTLKMSEERSAQLFSLLGVKLELKQVQTKTKRTHGSMDNIKYESGKQKTRKPVSESPRTSLLSSLPQTRMLENIPLVVIICVTIMEKLGLKNEGVYRKPGNEGARRKLENFVNTENAEKWPECEEWVSINTVGSLLKSMLRSYSLIGKDTAIKLSMINLTSVDPSKQSQVLMDMVYHLRQHLCKTEARMDGVKERPVHEMRCRLDTFKFVIKHLDRVSRYSECNKMSADNLATCFTPTIIEDIPCDEDGEYQTSKKSEADKNLKEMVSFWITNADLLCELLEEEDDQQRFRKLVHLLETNDNGDKHQDLYKEVGNEDVKAVVKELIEYYTSSVFIRNSSSSTSTATTPEFNNFSRLKNLGIYQSYKQPQKNGNVRRSSTSLSPKEQRHKLTPVDINIESVTKGASPLIHKKLEQWATKSFRGRRKELLPPARKELPLTSMRISGTTKNVPLVVDVCVRIIETFGLDVDGVYRVSGMRQEIIMLEELVLSNKYLNWSEEPHATLWANIYTVSCLLKSILKQFCLIKKETWVHMSSQFSEKMDDKHVRKVLMAAAYHLRYEKKKPRLDSSEGYLDRIHKDTEDDIRNVTLRYVLRHLKKVSNHVNNNRMTSSSLAVCFVPVLMEEDATGDIISMNNKGIQILEKLIDHCDWIFKWDDTPCEDMYGKVMGDSLDEYLRRYSVSETKMPKLDVNLIIQYLVDTESVCALLQHLITESHIAAQNRVTLRRHSDDTDRSSRKPEFRASKMLDDSVLPDKLIADSMTTPCSRNLQLTDS